jgi:hypothetical protein
LEVNDSAVKVVGDESLRTLARELLDSGRRNVTIDWTVKESATQAKSPALYLQGQSVLTVRSIAAFRDQTVASTLTRRMEESRTNW